MTERILHIADQGKILCMQEDTRLPDNHGFVSIESVSNALQHGKMKDKALCLDCVKTVVHTH
jgi:hypothetical protein